MFTKHAAAVEAEAPAKRECVDEIEPISDDELRALELNANAKARVPIIYTDAYNIGFFGIEKLHPFDSAKYQKVFKALTAERALLLPREMYSPIEATPRVLRLVHPTSYLKSLESSRTVASIMEVPPVAMLPNWLVQSKALKPMRHAVAGSMLGTDIALRSMQAAPCNAAAAAAAAAAAGPSAVAASSAPVAAAGVRSGWSVNLSGGYHHCSARSGGGFCAYADISLCVLYAAKKHHVTRVIIVDCDAHQGNGHENDKRNGVFRAAGVEVFILDMFNSSIYPHDSRAATAIDCPVRLQSGIGDDEYLALLREHLAASLDKFPAQLVIYNAGTDCLAGDALGRMNLSADGIAQRDHIVFDMCLQKGIPLTMMLSGGYQKTNAAVIASSIANLHSAFDLWTVDPSLRHKSGKF